MINWNGRKIQQFNWIHVNHQSIETFPGEFTEIIKTVNE